MGYINVPGGSKIDIIKGEQFNSDQITLKTLANLDARVSADDYVFINENCSLVLDTPTITPLDYTGTTKQINSIASSTASNNGRRIVRLDNGWIIATSWSAGYNYFYVSKDNGATFTQLCYIYASYINSAGLSIVSKGNIVYWFGFLNAKTGWFSGKFDATTITNVDLDSTKVLVDGTYNAGSFNVSIAIGSDGVLHLAWSLKNASYPNSFNIRYAKSINDGASWTLSQITTYNSTQVNFYSPCIIVNALNNPVIVYSQEGVTGASGRGIAYSYYTAGAWGANAYGSNFIYDGIAGYYAQENPSLAMDSTGVIHMVWEGYTSGTGAKNILYANSTTNGGTWNGATLLTSGNVRMKINASISINQNNDLLVLFSGTTDTTPSYYQLHFIKKPNAGAWSAITVYTVRTSNTATGVAMIEKDILSSDLPMAIFTGDSDYLRMIGKWSVSNSPQLIKSVVNAVTSVDFKALSAGLLKSDGSSAKIYNGFISKTDLGFTTL